MSDEQWQVITGDCLEVMPTLAPGSVDAILTDLPYGTTACSWDSVIPFAPMWAAIKHVLKPRGVFVTTASQPFTSALVMSNVKWFRYEWVWEKDAASNFAACKFVPMKVHENVVLFSANGHTYNPVMWDAGRLSNAGGINKKGDIYGRRGKLQTSYTGSTFRYPRSVMRVDKPKHNAADKKIDHPTQKPVALYEYLIRTYTNAGELVLDMCAGSGTTGVAAINVGRRVICIEQREDYADIARGRIAKAAEQARQLTLGIEQAA